MRFTLAAVVAASAVLVAAQTKSDCAAQNIVEACLGTQMPQLQACAANDWDCMCTQSNNVLTCYNNCPADPRRIGQQQQNESYCNAAKAYPSTSSTVSYPTPTGSSSAVSSASPTLAAGVTPSASATATPSASSTVKPVNGSSGAGGVGVSIAGLIGAIAFALA